MKLETYCIVFEREIDGKDVIRLLIEPNPNGQHLQPYKLRQIEHLIAVT